MVGRSNSPGYTLLELILVLGIIAALVTMALFGLSNYSNTQQVKNTALEFVSNVRSLQNKTANGIGGLSYRQLVIATSSQYLLDGAAVVLPPKVTVSPNTNVYLCLAHPDVVSFQLGQCGSCPAGSYFACVNGSPVGSGNLDITFTNSAYSRTIRIEGSGLVINRIYELP